MISCQRDVCPIRRLLVQPQPHADQPMQGGVGIDEGVQRFVAFAVALGCRRTRYRRKLKFPCVCAIVPPGNNRGGSDMDSRSEREIALLKKLLQERRTK